MEALALLALWLLVLIAFAGVRIISWRLEEIVGRLNGIRGLLSSDGPDPDNTSWGRKNVELVYSVKALLEEVEKRRKRTEG